MYGEPDKCRFSEGFDDNCARLTFIRKVFALLILALMMMFVQIMIVAIT